MTYSKTTITTRGYSVELPTAAVTPFLSLSHDDQVEMADVLNSLDDDGEFVDPNEDTGNEFDLMVESMTQELDVQDQAIDTFMVDRLELQNALGDYRRELNRVANDNEALNDILLQSARYVGQMRELLGQIGVVIKTDPANGEPVLLFVA